MSAADSFANFLASPGLTCVDSSTQSVPMASVIVAVLESRGLPPAFFDAAAAMFPPWALTVLGAYPWAAGKAGSSDESVKASLSSKHQPASGT